MTRSKKQKAVDYDGEDIISNLPNDIPSHILSFLSTKEAAQTSLLSKRWRYAWTCVTSLDLHDGSQYKEHAPIAEKQKFLELVNRILLHRISTSGINSFTLRLLDPTVKYSSHNLNALICRVLEQNVQKLKLFITYRTRLPVFPCAVFNSRSLIELEIGMFTSLKFPSSNCLTNLQILIFSEVDLFSNSKELMLSFPILKMFKIDHCTLFDVNGLIINAPMLENFEIRYPQFMEKLANKSSCVSRTIKLFALHLKKFFYYGNLEDDIILSNPLAINDAFFNVDLLNFQDEKVQKAHRLLKRFREVKFLELGPKMILALGHLKDDSLLRLPIFERLVYLLLASWDSWGFFNDILLKLLQKLPNLHTLELNAHESKFGTILSSSKDIPHCIQYNLKVVIIRLSEWDGDKFQFTKYVLENAQVLNQLTVSMKAVGVRRAIKELKSIPKASSSAEIKGNRTVEEKLDGLCDKYNEYLF